MKTKKRERIPVVNLGPRDTIVLLNDDEELLREDVGRSVSVDEVAIFEVEEGDFPGANDGIGGAFLSSENK